MAVFPGPTSEQYKRMSWRAKFGYWSFVIAVFLWIACVWIFE